MARGIVSAELFRQERLRLNTRTSDPTSPATNEWWLRLDQGDGVDVYGELRFYDGSSTRSVEIVPPGQTQPEAEEVLRVQTPDGVGVIPVSSRTDAQIPQFSFQHNGSSLGLGQPSAIPNGVIDNYEPESGDPAGVYESGEDIYDYWHLNRGSSGHYYRTTGLSKNGSHSLYQNAPGSTTSELVSEPGDGLPYYPQRGDVFSFWFYINITSSDGDGPRSWTYFGFDSRDTSTGYAIRHRYGRSPNEIQLYGDGTMATGALPSTNTWTLYVVDYDSNDDGTITLAYYNSSLNLIDQISISDTAYNGRGIGMNNNADGSNPLDGEMWYDEWILGDQGAGYI